MEKKKIERGIKFLGKFSNAGWSVGGGGRQTDSKSFGGGETVGNGRKPVCVCVCDQNDQQWSNSVNLLRS
jgi:uncharacterized spore protein YtfJ